MIAFPFCKINLGLRVLDKRDDGYHNIETCLFPVPWKDVLEIIPSNTFSIALTGLEIPGQQQSNIVVKAYEILEKDFSIGPVEIHLHKIIPTGAGLGGGSSDGAHTLKVLNNLFALGLSKERLAGYASRLGSDCPFFLESSPMIATGRGEVLENISVDLSGYTLVIVKPNVHVSTADAYERLSRKLNSVDHEIRAPIGKPLKPLKGALKNIEPQKDFVPLKNLGSLKGFEGDDGSGHALTNVLGAPVDQWRFFLKNDFEDSVFEAHPMIGDVKSRLYKLGATYASMSGSGSSVFGLFKDDVSCENKFPGMVCWKETIKH
jgi:4-diphosphocytidyl-2-C-methyl-D-erythritol kinase